ncbi:MAG: hypothetical protein H6595_03290 [Flavobacteriales bacterium]|nr:hypothetical protein [Flavobacteriales bacterium]MCB9166482.1 hypothetical protein [Flavobacteriales bacterium]
MTTGFPSSDENVNGKRPDMITGLGVLSFVNIGLFLIVYLLGLFAMMGMRSMPEEQFISTVQDSMARFNDMFPEETMSQVDEVMHIIYSSGVLLMGLYLLRTIVRLVGVVGMWRGRKQGFATYAIAQVGGIFLPHLVLPLKYMGLFGPLLALAMVVLYGTQRKHLH